MRPHRGSVLTADAIFGGADLEDKIGSALQVMGESRFARIHPAARKFGALRQGPNRSVDDAPKLIPEILKKERAV